MKITNVEVLCATGLLLSFLITASSSASATTVFSDNFEDGDHVGWLSTIVPGAGGSGLTDVALHNSSQMAYAFHRGKGRHSLSQDFNYFAEDILSFDMHAVAISGKSNGGITLHSSSGVVMSFLNFLNQPLGKISLVNATNPGALGSGSIAIDSAQHDYTAKMSDFALSAGLGSNDPITKISLDFFATADYSFGGNIVPNGYSSATVWLDNVAINPVPVPSAVWLFGSGLIGFIGMRKNYRK